MYCWDVGTSWRSRLGKELVEQISHSHFISEKEQRCGKSKHEVHLKFTKIMQRVIGKQKI